MKTQNVRLLDVFVFGPFMLYAAVKRPRLTPLERTFMALMGLGTIVYNWQNYVIERDRAA